MTYQRLRALRGRYKELVIAGKHKRAKRLRQYIVIRAERG